MKRSQKSDAPPFPAGSRVLARLHPLELERGILIPGHRLEPLRNGSLPPWLVEIEDDEGIALDSRTVGLSLSDAALFYRLFGQAAFPFMVLGQADSNRQALERGQDAIIRIVAFDAADFYERHGLAAGDYACISLLDASGERFIVEPLKAGDIDASERQAFLDGLALGVEATAEAFDGPLDPITFIREVFSRSPGSTLTSPKASFSEFYNESGILEARDYGGTSFLCKKGQRLVPSMAPGPESFQDTTELERVIIEAGISITEEELKAYVRDAIYAGKKPVAGVDKAFTGLAGIGMPKRLYARLMRLAIAFAEREASDYDAGSDSQELAALRSSLLDIHADFLAWMRRVGDNVTDERELESDYFSSLFELMRYVTDLMAILNDYTDADEDEEDEDEEDEPQRMLFDDDGTEYTDDSDEFYGPDFLEEALESMPKIRSEAKALMARAEASLTKASPAGPRIVARKPSATSGKRPQRPDAKKAYILEVRLCDMEPPITRKLYVPGNRNLAELHAVIQAAFGWQDEHLHHFRWKDQAYGVPDPENFQPVLNEREYRLEDLNPRRGSRIEYVYDYGDDWRHELLVALWAKPRAHDPDFPACISGDRAAPPEDCGGLPGYLALVDALAKPARSRNRDEKNLVSWAGDWDPERFDIDEVNERLSLMR